MPALTGKRRASVRDALGTVVSPHARPAVRRFHSLEVQRYWRLVERLYRMSAGEAATRVRGVVVKRLPARLSDTRRPSSANAFLELLGSPRINRIRQRFDDRFLFGPGDRAVLSERIQVEFPEREAHVVRFAERAETEGVEILGVRVRLKPGAIDWHADPVSGLRAWSLDRIDEAAAIGVVAADVKHVWEVNRHQFLTTFGRGFWLTGDERFARLAADLIDDWIAANPVGSGVNWSSHLEVSMRAISWLWTMPFLLSWPDLSERFLERWLASLADHYDHLVANLSVYTDPTNHLLGEATGLWMLCTVFPELPASQVQRARAMDVLAREVGRQVTRDGVNMEQATSYHRFVLDFILQIVALGRRIGETLPSVFESRARGAMAFIAALIGPGGDVPMIGDSDDARGLPLTEIAGWDFRDLLSTGAVLFGRHEWKGLAGGLAEPTLWLLGDTAAEMFHRLDAPRPATSGAAIQGGYCVFSSETPDLKVQSIFDAGPMGLWPNAAHGHADALSVLIRVNGELLLGDPGTGTYFADASVRDRLRGTASHNTLTIDGLDQADMFGVFKWVNPVRVDLLAHFGGNRFDYAVGRHNGYRRLRNGVTHYRHVLSIHPSSWVIVDRLEGAGQHVVTRRFHFTPGTHLRCDAPGSFVAVSSVTGAGLRFTVAENPRDVEVTCDEGGSVWSREYGRWQTAPSLSIESCAIPPSALCVVVTAFAGREDARLSDVAGWVADSAPMGGPWLWSRRSGEARQQMIMVNPAAQRVALPDGRCTDASFLFASLTPHHGDAFLAFDASTREGGVTAMFEEREGASTSLMLNLA